MSKDISPILDGWEFDPEHVTVRLVKGSDGRDKVQMRLDLGLLQMELDGRPDGRKIFGHESWLDYLKAEQKDREAQVGAEPFQLTADHCENLLREGIQYYHRYLSFWYLRRFELCARDTQRNLRLFSFVRKFASKERDKLQFDQWRPYVLMMHARAVATSMLESGDAQAAIAAIDRGITGIEEFLEEYNQAERAATLDELTFLKHWRSKVVADHGPPEEAIVEKPPQDPVTRLRGDLEVAIAEERYEDAARLRDEIHRLTNAPRQ